MRTSSRAATIRLHGITGSSPLGALLASSASAYATVAAGTRPTVAPKHWMAHVQGTRLQWWDAELPSDGLAGTTDPADIVIDCFGDDGAAGSAARVWRLVDGSGEPVLNPFCLVERCCRRPYVVSLYVVERVTGGSGWDVLGEAHIATRLRYTELLDRAARVAAHLVANALRTAGDTPARRRAGIVPSRPSRSTTSAAAELLRARAARAVMSARQMACSERWAIGALDVPLERVTRAGVPPVERWIPSQSRAAFLADPFPWPGRSDVLLCERYDYRSQLGSLRAITVAKGTIVDDRAVDLRAGDAHLSYPFLYEENGRVFLLPEMAASGELALFELVSPSEARRVCVIDAGTRIADPTLFLHQGLYWIAYTDLAFGVDDNLCLLYAPRLAGPWTPHPGNPVKIDIRSSRPGGTPFSHDGKLYRPAQDCSTTYGANVALNLVRVCTPDRYEEDVAAVLRPDRRGPYPDGLHTLSIDGTRVLVDGKKIFFDPRRFARQLRARFARAARPR